MIRNVHFVERAKNNFNAKNLIYWMLINERLEQIYNLPRSKILMCFDYTFIDNE